MKWVWVAGTVISGSVGDLLSAYGMSHYGEIPGFTPSVIRRILVFIVSHRSVVLGIAANAISFVSFMALLSIAPLTFAVPVTGVGYILRTMLAKIFLHESIGAKRWAGVVLVAVGVVLIAL